MSQFEYVSVAVALVLSLALARLLGGISAATQRDRAYPIHLCWIGQTLLTILAFWWGSWFAPTARWTGIRFAWTLVIPSLLYVKAQILIGPNPESVDSYRDLFYRNRVRFFTVSLLVPLAASVTPLVEGHSFETFRNLLPLVAPGIAVNIVGLAVRDPRVHAVLVAVGLAIPIAGLLFVEVALPPSG